MKLAVDYWLDPKWKGLGSSHEAFYVRLLGYTRKWDTDGFIPANAIALCGRRIYNRDKVLGELVKAGLLEECPDDSSAYVFPKSWRKYSASIDQSSNKIAGQGGRSRGGGEEKRRFIYPTDRSTLPPEREVPGYRFLAGSGWIKDHGTDEAAEQGS